MQLAFGKEKELWEAQRVILPPPVINATFAILDLL